MLIDEINVATSSKIATILNNYILAFFFRISLENPLKVDEDAIRIVSEFWMMAKKSLKE